MSITKRLKKISFRLASVSYKKNRYVNDIDAQKAYLASFPAPKDLLERSYFQYKCQKKLQSGLVKVFYGIASFFSCPVLCILLFCHKKSAPVKRPEGKVAVTVKGDKSDSVIPHVLSEEFALFPLPAGDGYLIGKDRAVLGALLRYWYAPEFICKCLLKVSQYRRALDMFSPDAIIGCSEFSFTSSVCTWFLRREGVEHINVMHGEKTYLIRDSFVSYDRFYVWDKVYADLLQTLGASPEQFRVEIPPALCFDLSQKIEKEYDFTYYLGAEKSEDLVRLADALHRLQNAGYTVNVRPHPRYTDLAAAKSILTGISVEDFKQVGLEVSVLRSRHVISQQSTVLLQAFCNGVPCVIDDVTNPNLYRRSQKEEYVMLKKEHTLLSALIS